MTHQFQVGHLTDIDPTDPCFDSRDIAGERAKQLSMARPASFYGIWERASGARLLGIAYDGRVYWEEGTALAPALGWRQSGAKAA